ncbi:MAG: NAD(P)H-dependent oxidoreductase subunit E [Anaerolineales bacterium]
MTEVIRDAATFDDYLRAAAPQGRTMLLPALIEAQDRYGFVSKETAMNIGRALKVPLADVTGVIEFYSMLHTEPRGETFLRVCVSPTCASRGSQELIRQTSQRIQVEPGHQDPTGRYFLEPVACLGLCDHAPAALVDQSRVGHATPERLLEPGERFHSELYSPEPILTKRCGKIDPTSVEEYRAAGGFQGLEAALKLPPQEVIEMVKASGLKGRGGAGFPTGVKWEATAAAEGEIKYIVCNEDESEPGTFKDRALIEGDPLAIIEGMLIGAYAAGINEGYLYIRGEYPRAHHVLQQALDSAREAGYLGENILGSGLSLTVELRKGAGAYICGEETALFESIEGKRGFPRIKPPFPTTHGLFGKPTIINNVETFANIPFLLRQGVEAYRQYGSEAAPGPRLFSLSGAVSRPGIYEVARPITLRELIYERAGGLRTETKLKAVLFGGAAGKFVHPRDLDLLLTEEAAQEAGLSLGSGAVMVFDESTDLKDVLASLGGFFAHESCGKCYPCQLGTQRQAEILARLQAGKPAPGDQARLQDVGWTMTDASLCGLGQTAALAVLSAMELWPEIFEGMD